MKSPGTCSPIIRAEMNRRISNLRAPNTMTLHSRGLFRHRTASGSIDHPRMACFAFLARGENARSRCDDHCARDSKNVQIMKLLRHMNILRRFFRFFVAVLTLTTEIDVNSSFFLATVTRPPCRPEAERSGHLQGGRSRRCEHRRWRPTPQRAAAAGRSQQGFVRVS